MALCDVQLQVSGYFFAFLIPIIYKYCLENTNLFVNNTHKCKIVFSFVLNRRKKKGFLLTKRSVPGGSLKKNDFH